MSAHDPTARRASHRLAGRRRQTIRPSLTYFGRQRAEPRDLFNVDYLTLHTGKKIPVSIEQLLSFASNLDSADFAQEAFLRRLGYRLREVCGGVSLTIRSSAPRRASGALRTRAA